MAGKKIGERPKIILVADYEGRFIWYEGGNAITFSLAVGIIRILKKLNELSHKPITFYISGVGGDAYAFIKLAHMIEKIESPVTFVAFGSVCSGCFWITQCGNACFAVASAKFMFHRAVVYCRSGKTNMSQRDFFDGLKQLMLIDAVQFWIFTRRGSPVKTILKLFEREATISVQKAIELNLVSEVYDNNDFDKDKKRAEELAREKYNF